MGLVSLPVLSYTLSKNGYLTYTLKSLVLLTQFLV